MIEITTQNQLAEFIEDKSSGIVKIKFDNDFKNPFYIKIGGWKYSPVKNTLIYFENGKIHRKEGPAVINNQFDFYEKFFMEEGLFVNNKDQCSIEECFNGVFTQKWFDEKTRYHNFSGPAIKNEKDQKYFINGEFFWNKVDFEKEVIKRKVKNL